ncbi:triose-phosphate isomerase [Pseudidiomarina terrestris]|uniref:triose-phosphate isomerase n=1 Tax=Pseudidiomarina terrestris TaxID=2820060 RepID=UPI00264FE127|nr:MULTISPECIES: triose-phosphate isomerase [unclassified Pseudidiomarina]MDN7127849.1 triose-phosphate isomerase [Pseudidiomarina sp. 1APR75-33.1]MDN7134781.1 triose-phosphate isomerase [Pseudidiomarina sp. 1ASP75-5]MDN7137459.1 triose-phosphate isomerase [Pseudidiomarina sp. 1ASP75-14]MEA3587431.1 triose-phosphate isomerase [Pseudidiomarina sp. 1APP75-27a]
MQRQPLVIANWKMNGNRHLTSQLAEALRESGALLNDVSVVVCPPAVLLPAWQSEVFYDDVHLGAQDVNEHHAGAHTGEHSLQLLTETGAEYVLIGHSERRQLYGDSDDRVQAKVDAVLAFQEQKLKVVLCLGEHEHERDNGETFARIEGQLAKALANVSAAQLAHVVIAYEPVWAIGTGKTASPQQAQEVHAFIRNWLQQRYDAAAATVPLLYGGSVKADSAPALFAETDIDGGLIGGASLEPEAFLAICRAAQARRS